MKNFSNIKNSILIIVLFFFGLYLSFQIKYGGDIDSHAVILSFLKMLKDGIYIPNRFYGSLVGELILGFIAYNFGGVALSFFCFILFFSSFFFIFKYIKFKIKFKNERFIYLIFLCFSNPILLLHNTSPSEFPIALFFFSLGLFYISKNFFFLSIIPFAISISARAEYLIYVLTILIFELYYNKNHPYIEKHKKYLIFLTLFITSALYFPSFIYSKFNLAFVINSGGPEFSLDQLLPRFIFKIYFCLGIYSSFLILFFSIKDKIFLNFFENNILNIIIFANLFIFFIIPTKPTILSLALIFFYFILSSKFNKKVLSLIVLLNLISWLVSYEFLNVKYLNTNKCDAVRALNVQFKFKFKLKEGIYKQYISRAKDLVECNAPAFELNKELYKKGYKLNN